MEFREQIKKIYRSLPKNKLDEINWIKYEKSLIRILNLNQESLISFKNTKPFILNISDLIFFQLKSLKDLEEIETQWDVWKLIEGNYSELNNVIILAYKILEFKNRKKDNIYEYSNSISNDADLESLSFIELFRHFLVHRFIEVENTRFPLGYQHFYDWIRIGKKFNYFQIENLNSLNKMFTTKNDEIQISNFILTTEDISNDIYSQIKYTILNTNIKKQYKFFLESPSGEIIISPQMYFNKQIQNISSYPFYEIYFNIYKNNLTEQLQEPITRIKFLFYTKNLLNLFEDINRLIYNTLIMKT
ncbi:hypothetical protein CK556_02640 [Mesoplasma chauliocola]|uniref:Uncharacterized protein n=1 Tax=Mesoplasma chauliocola TaxID=216427 RepID=A0A249SNP5_9MOLU|nr:hypothetical protein [Mesoplasma chauliocola]ASZ09237.1 hypothetical protein CK556_02640 [Mesoplasma chauliocola]